MRRITLIPLILLLPVLGLAQDDVGFPFGKTTYSAQADGSNLSISNIFSLAKPLYAPEEYPYLRELYAKIIQAENTDIIFRKK